MFGAAEAGALRTAIVGDVGRTEVRLALIDDDGRLRRETIRTYEAASQSTISGTISTFGRDLGLTPLPRRCAIAVAGAIRGDTISVTGSRWLISRSGLHTMLQGPPLIINDFAAVAWSLSAREGESRIEQIEGGPINSASRTGTYCIIGVGEGLGVAALARDANGHVHVLATEAGHMACLPATPDHEAVLAVMRRRSAIGTAEGLVSAAGLVSIYAACAEMAGQPPRATDAEGVVRLAGVVRDPVAVRALDLFLQALWHFAGNMVLAYAAWDGVILTGTLVQALALHLRKPEPRSHFIQKGPHMRALQTVPRGMFASDQGELDGAAEALRHYRQ